MKNFTGLTCILSAKVKEENTNTTSFNTPDGIIIIEKHQELNPDDELIEFYNYNSGNIELKTKNNFDIYKSQQNELYIVRPEFKNYSKPINFKSIKEFFIYDNIIYVFSLS